MAINTRVLEQHRKIMAGEDLKPPVRGIFRDRVGSSSYSHARPVLERARDRVVSGPVSTQTERKRTESVFLRESGK